MKPTSLQVEVLEEANRYLASPLSKIKVEKLFEKLEDWMTVHQPYLQNDMNLQHIAKELDSNSSYVSRAINEMSGKGVSHYINSYRIKRFLELLEEEDLNRLTLGSIAKKSGFRSFSTFYRAFRMELGCKPTDYLREFLPVQG